MLEEIFQKRVESKTYHDHVTGTGSGETVQSGTETLDSNDVEVSSTGVVAAVHDGTHGETELIKHVNIIKQRRVMNSHGLISNQKELRVVDIRSNIPTF